MLGKFWVPNMTTKKNPGDLIMSGGQFYEVLKNGSISAEPYRRDAR